ncbi:MAG: alkaline phosphatase family protein [Gemmatimonadaceae bacterium]
MAYVIAPFILTACGVAGGGRGDVGRAAAAQSDSRYVVVLSFDGLRRDFLTRDSLPAFASLAAEGTRAASLRPVFPSKTFAIHYTLVTGLYPGHHGIVGSRFYDPARGSWFSGASAGDSSWFGGEPIWVTAENQGVRSAVFFWTGSEAAVRGVRPSQFRIFDPNVADTTKVDQIAAWLRLPAADRPHLIMAYFPEIDAAGHLIGPDAPETRAAVRSADRTVVRLADSLRAMPRSLDIDLIVVSDPGMAPVSRDRVVELAPLVPMSRVLLTNERTTVSIWSRGDDSRDALLIDSVYRVLHQRLSHARVFRLNELPEQWHAAGNRKLGDLLVVADEGYVLGTDTVPPNVRRGEHGYDPSLASMQGIFLARGPSFRRGIEVPTFEQVALYPVLAHLLRLRPAPSLDGSLSPLRAALVDALTPPRRPDKAARAHE